MPNQFAIVTGGSAGIGLEIARLLARDSYDLLISGSSDKVYKAAAELSKAGVNVTPVQSDLSTPSGTQLLLDAATSSGRAIDLLILNAGIATGGAAFVDMPIEKHLQLIGLNTVSPVMTAHAIVPQMIAKGQGRVMLVSSLSALSPTPFEGVYGPSKAFLTSFGHGLREELAGTGVQITIFQPGATATQFHARAGMHKTEFGDNTWKDNPADVARQAYEALLRGDNVVPGDNGILAQKEAELRSLPEEEKARRHAKRTKPSL